MRVSVFERAVLKMWGEGGFGGLECWEVSFLRVFWGSKGYERVGEIGSLLDSRMLSYTIPVMSLLVLVVLVIDVRERLCFQSTESFLNISDFAGYKIKLAYVTCG